MKTILLSWKQVPYSKKSILQLVSSVLQFHQVQLQKADVFVAPQSNQKPFFLDPHLGLRVKIQGGRVEGWQIQHDWQKTGVPLAQIL